MNASLRLPVIAANVPLEARSYDVTIVEGGVRAHGPARKDRLNSSSDRVREGIEGVQR